MVSSCMTDFFCPNQALVSEIHLLFDTPGSDMNFNPKYLSKTEETVKRKDHLTITYLLPLQQAHKYLGGHTLIVDNVKHHLFKP